MAALDQGLRRGWRMLHQHCVECRGRVRIPANFNMLVDLVNIDLNLWRARVFHEATNFAAMHESPPTVGEFPEITVPAWTRISQYIGAGGLPNSQHHPMSCSSPPGYGKGRSTTTPSRKKGYCWAWADGSCTRTAGNCDYEHARDPHGGRSGGNHNGGRRGRGGGHTKGSTGKAGREDTRQHTYGGGGRSSGGSSAGSAGRN